MAALALILCVVALGVGARDANAATVRLVPNTETGEVSFTLRYVAAPGEANRLTAIESRDGRVWTFREAGATVQPGANCAAGGDGSIACMAPATVAAPLTSSVVLDLGDQDDVADVSTAHSGVGDLLAGAGNDRLRVLSGFVNASMGPGDDVARWMAASCRSRAALAPTAFRQAGSASCRCSTSPPAKPCTSRRMVGRTTARPASTTTSRGSCER